MTWVKRRKGWRICCDVRKVKEMLENEQSSPGDVREEPVT